MRFLCQWWLLSVLAVVLSATVQANSDSKETPGAIYIPMSPAFVVNYGGKGRLKYLKAKLSIRVDDAQTAAAVRHNMPLLRNAMVMLFSRQDDEAVATQEGIQQLRQTAVEEIKKLLQSEQSPDRVLEVDFDSFVIQK